MSGNSQSEIHSSVLTTGGAGTARTNRASTAEARKEVM